MPIKLGLVDVTLRSGSSAVASYLGAQVASRLLDGHGGATAAFSLRLLRSAYSGPLVRVRRSSDSAEADFTEAEINGGELASWVGSGNDGFVRTLYDQTGNNRHMNQTTAGRQPKLVGSGAVILQDNKPTLEFYNSRGDYLTTGDIGVNVPVDAYLVARFRDLTVSGPVGGVFGRAGTVSGLFIRYSTSNGHVNVGNNTNIHAATTYANTTRRIWNVYFDSGVNSLFFVNATQVASGNAGAVNPGGFALGTDAQIIDRSANVNIQEAVLYGSSQAKRAVIREEINSYYSVY